MQLTIRKIIKRLIKSAIPSLNQAETEEIVKEIEENGVLQVEEEGRLSIYPTSIVGIGSNMDKVIPLPKYMVFEWSNYNKEQNNRHWGIVTCNNLRDLEHYITDFGSHKALKGVLIDGVAVKYKASKPAEALIIHPYKSEVIWDEPYYILSYSNKTTKEYHREEYHSRKQVEQRILEIYKDNEAFHFKNNLENECIKFILQGALLSSSNLLNEKNQPMIVYVHDGGLENDTDDLEGYYDDSDEFDEDDNYIGND